MIKEVFDLTEIQHELLNLLKNNKSKEYICSGKLIFFTGGEYIGYGYKTYSNMYICKGKFWYRIKIDVFPNTTKTMFNEYNI